MPMPKPKKLKDLSICGKTPKKMIKVVKPEKHGLSDVYLNMAKLAKEKKEKDKEEK